MHRQQPLALAPPAGGADWSERSLLDAATRRALQSINLAFLELAGEFSEEGRLKQIPGLPPRAIDALIGVEAGPRLCERLPFALFDLRFASAWRSVTCICEPSTPADDTIDQVRAMRPSVSACTGDPQDG